MNYYRRYPGDYLRDTQQLSNAEHGMYTLLLDTLYATEKPISLADGPKVAHVYGKQKSAYKRLLLKYFIVTEEGIWHKRVDEELKRANSRRNRAQQSAVARWNKDAPRNASSIEKNAPRNALHTPDSIYTPYSPPYQGDANPATEQLVLTVYGELVLIDKPRNRRLWTETEKESLKGKRAHEYAEFFQSKGFPARVEGKNGQAPF